MDGEHSGLFPVECPCSFYRREVIEDKKEAVKTRRVEVWATSCPQNGKLPLKADEPQVVQRHKDVKRKQEY